MTLARLNAPQIDAPTASAIERYVRAAVETAAMMTVRQTAISEAVQDADEMVLVDATAGAVTITLPAAAGSLHRVIRVKKIDASVNVVTIDGNGAETIDGAATASLASQWAGAAVVSNGTAWFKL